MRTGTDSRPYSRFEIRIAAGTFASVLVGGLLLVANLDENARAQETGSMLEVPAAIAERPAPAQPLPYSHKTHLALGLTCETCHTSPAPGAAMTFPATSVCMSCHTGVAADRPAIIELKSYSDSGEAVPWSRVYRVLPGVAWSHRPHIAAGVQCGACHGDVAQVETMSMTTSVTAMASCISCHESRGASSDCVTCHAWPQK